MHLCETLAAVHLCSLTVLPFLYNLPFAFTIASTLSAQLFGRCNFERCMFVWCVCVARLEASDPPGARVAGTCELPQRWVLGNELVSSVRSAEPSLQPSSTPFYL